LIYSLNEILKKIKLFKEIYATPEFESDFKNLLKKYKTLIEDFEIFIKAQLFLFHKKQIDNKGIVLISDTGIISPKIYKAKKFSCKALKGKGVQSGIRVIYAYFEEEDRIEFLEIYYKGDKDSENRKRFIRYKQ
jgi:mRNA-degrading endonuclease RelE of RelBE toxin-antitoxin system